MGKNVRNNLCASHHSSLCLSSLLSASTSESLYLQIRYAAGLHMTQGLNQNLSHMMVYLKTFIKTETLGQAFRLMKAVLNHQNFER